MLITGLYQPILWLADRFFIRINKDFIIIIIIRKFDMCEIPHEYGPALVPFSSWY